MLCKIINYNFLIVTSAVKLANYSASLQIAGIKGLLKKSLGIQTGISALGSFHNFLSRFLGLSGKCVWLLLPDAVKFKSWSVDTLSSVNVHFMGFPGSD